MDCFQRKTKRSPHTRYIYFCTPRQVSLTSVKNGFHELHNEPGGVKEKLFEECIAWVEAHLSSGPTSKL
ncbi:hypothetical protein J3R82DRAFT_1395 [Butyriboletus roseoflavus]|nr:hypothetical protein J3R82DRAFT_1395 [Butyriboletus roseoflavus]